MKTDSDVLTLVCSLLDLPDKKSWDDWNRAQEHQRDLPKPPPTYTVIEYEDDASIIVRQNTTGATFRIVVGLIRPGTAGG